MAVIAMHGDQRDAAVVLGLGGIVTRGGVQPNTKAPRHGGSNLIGRLPECVSSAVEVPPEACALWGANRIAYLHVLDLA